MAIRFFADKQAEMFYVFGRLSKGVAWGEIRKVALRKLDMLSYAVRLEDLKSPPGNRLEALAGNLTGYHSIRLNDQWRIVFRWSHEGAEAVRIVDYH